MRRTSLFFATVAFCGYAGAALATPISIDTWYLFDFGGPGSALDDGSQAIPTVNPVSTPAPTPSWDFTLTSTAKLLVTDLSLSGDTFSIFNFGSLLGNTSLAIQGSDCGQDLGCALANSNFSHGTFVLGAGSYSLTGLVVDTPFGKGTGAFKVSAVPVPAALPLLATALAGLGLTGRRGKRKSS